MDTAAAATVDDVKSFATASWPETHPCVTRVLWTLHCRSLNRLSGSPIPSTIPSMLSLEWLDISKNSITELTEQMQALRNLQHLNVSSNQLTTFPKWLGELRSLRTLNYSRNFVKRMPLKVSGLQGLLTLDLSVNRLTRLPEEMDAAFGSLRHLLLYNNRLQYLPITMAPLLERLTTFDCTRNPLLVRARVTPTVPFQHFVVTFRSDASDCWLLGNVVSPIQTQGTSFVGLFVVGGLHLDRCCHRSCHRRASSGQMRWAVRPRRQTPANQCWTRFLSPCDASGRSNNCFKGMRTDDSRQLRP